MREARVVTWGIHLVAGLGLQFTAANIAFRGNPRHWQVSEPPPKPVKVRVADGREQQRIRLRRSDPVKAWVKGHDVENSAMVKA
jgi:hypothetical protein